MIAFFYSTTKKEREIISFTHQHTGEAAAGSERRERETRRLEIGEVLRKPKECEWIHLPVKDLADPCWMPRKDDFLRLVLRCDD